jgi:glyoxylase-like metal-dependent hydrolase (beta-lactamase superfamily II)
VLFVTSGQVQGQTISDPVIGSKGYHVGSYGDGAYWITDGLYNSMFIVSDEGVIVIDAPQSYAKKIPDAIREVTDKTVKYFIYSHHHADHTAGSAIFGDEVIRIGHQLTARELRRKNDPNRPVPTITFSDSYTVKLGTQQVELSYPGLQHSPGNVFIYLPKQKVLMLVDVLYPGWVPFEDFAVAASVPGYFRAFDQAKEYDFKFFQGGHVGRPGTRQEFDIAQEYIVDIQKNAGKALQTVKPPLSLTGKDNPTKEPYIPFNTYLNAVSDVCAQITQEKWEYKLKAGNLYTRSHCWTTALNLIID